MSTADGTARERIAGELRAAIDSGQLAPGDRITGELELAEQHGVSRNIVRLALGDLRAEGLLDNPHGRKGGTRVAERPVPLPLSRYRASAAPGRARPDLGPWETACADAGISGHIEVLDVARETADERLAAHLGIPPGAEVIRRERRMHAAGRVAGVQTAWIPAALADGTPLAGAEKVIGGIYAEFARQGHTPVGADEDVTARLATATDRKALGLPTAAAVLEIWRTTRDSDGTPLETVRIVANAAAVRLTYDRLPL